jgi:hypothetical protein
VKAANILTSIQPTIAAAARFLPTLGFLFTISSPAVVANNTALIPRVAYAHVLSMGALTGGVTVELSLLEMGMAQTRSPSFGAVWFGASSHDRLAFIEDSKSGAVCQVSSDSADAKAIPKNKLMIKREAKPMRRLFEIGLLIVLKL